jgi:hypothetical protein
VRAIWESAVEAKREVASWPAWKRGEDVAPAAVEAPAPAVEDAASATIKK